MPGGSDVLVAATEEHPQIQCVTWDATGHVVALDLSSQSIYGGFNNSSSIFSLQYLQSLNLADNTYSSQIPSDSIPIEISCLTKLVTIDFSVLYLPGVPTLKLESPNLRMLVQNLTELRELYLNGVNISAQGKEWCRALSSSVPNLQVLSLPNCYLSGPLDSSLQKLRSLSSIRLDSNNFSAPVLEFLANFSNLTQLKLSSCGLKGTFPEKIFQVPTLQILDLSNNRLLEGSLPVFPQNGSLETLVLSNTKFSGKVPISVSNLKRLTRIELADCNFRGSIPNSMANLTQLVYMDLSGNAFSGPVPSFSLSKNLTRIDLSHNHLAGQILSSHWSGLENLVTLDLRNNSLNGSLPMHLFSLSSLQKIQLSNNQFSGPFSEFDVKSFSVLDTLDLSSNNLEGPIPVSVFDLKRLNILDLSSNKFNGTVELSSFQKLGNLTTLSLSYNNLSINSSVGNPTLPLLLNLTTLKLASCKLRTLPDLSTQSRLAYLDLSDNQIRGNIPNWIWKIGIGSLAYLNLSHNLLEDLQEPLSNFTPYLSILDLHSNQLHGQIPTPPQFCSYVDYSDNRFTSSIPDGIGVYISFTIFFSLSKNNITGNEALAVLNLGRNKFNGTIPGKFPVNCLLQTLDLSGNRIEGKIPGSLANCTALEVLNLGNNQMNGTFPCLLKNITTLRVLVLRGNKFQGSIGCPKSNSTWATLQIVDLAFNNFRGKLPAKSFSTWTAMMAGENEVQSKLKYLQFRVQQFSQLYYQDTVRVTSKGQEMELVKILSLFTSIDLSCNNFEGDIPEVMGNFTSLYVLNLSHNGFTGQIPSSIGNLRQLESLDLSRNWLSGEIPTQLANLNFLSVLNLSFNQLVGSIPTGNQLRTFSENSFLGNRGLCGFPLNASCKDGTPQTFDDRHSGDGGNTTTNMLMEFFQGFSKEEQVVEEELTEFGGGECSRGAEG
ncbi:Receptor-like protein 12 [Vitis vinifera]|uniref:Receptor-like protein 12 n=1 Tax=Vitis vinifera TaxID=29760 RepID=A0A438BRT9_VITVI|nr:Receptor-like protein 12 [Vitis vinifera]